MRRSRWLKSVTAHKVLVHQTNDASIEGLLVRDWADGITLRSASALKSGADATPLAGEVFIPHEKVALIQFEE